MIPTKKSITVAKASPIGDPATPSAILYVTGDVPDFGHDDRDVLMKAEAFYEEQASQVMEALKCLPGGTFDRVLVKMLESTATLFRVAHTWKVGE